MNQLSAKAAGTSAFFELNESRGDSRIRVISDSSLVLAKEAGTHGQGSFPRSSRTGYGGGCGRAIASASGRAVRCQCGERSPLERIGTVDRQSGGEASGRGSSVGADRGACRYDPLDG